MMMITEIVDTQFADIRLPCAHDGKTIQVSMVPLCAAMHLDSEQELRRIALDEDLGSHLKPLPYAPPLSGSNALPMGAVALWLHRLAQQTTDVGQRHRLVVLQQEGFATLLDQWSRLLQGNGADDEVAALKRQFKRMQAQIDAMDISLRQAETFIEREIIRAQLSQLCDFPVGPRSKQSVALDQFWRLVFARITDGAEINHARRSDRFLALNFRHLRNVLGEDDKSVMLTPELRNELKRSRYPHFLGVRVVNSRISRKSLRCWVFNLH
ncbi:hypothetical protein CAL29_02230 [Bordetella genomosp. 10]|uniref:Antirepressor protein ant N-terminal domain-containing protein n=1 Tax=Bordetella genomosp. 10 TaxID=1416804 RepID=A0A261SIP0_9BORD|nr:hypothetical protein [Bordetella genomosp. 10]OZI37266.1 hypothetical protein CAL29_02230 [Bordetella genomosp. 10]